MTNEVDNPDGKRRKLLPPYTVGGLNLLRLEHNIFSVPFVPFRYLCTYLSRTGKYPRFGVRCGRCLKDVGSKQ